MPKAVFTMEKLSKINRVLDRIEADKRKGVLSFCAGYATAQILPLPDKIITLREPSFQSEVNGLVNRYISRLHEDKSMDVKLAVDVAKMVYEVRIMHCFPNTMRIVSGDNFFSSVSGYQAVLGEDSDKFNSYLQDTNTVREILGHYLDVIYEVNIDY